MDSPQHQHPLIRERHTGSWAAYIINIPSLETVRRAVGQPTTSPHQRESHGQLGSLPSLDQSQTANHNVPCLSAGPEAPLALSFSWDLGKKRLEVTSAMFASRDSPPPFPPPLPSLCLSNQNIYSKLKPGSTVLFLVFAP